MSQVPLYITLWYMRACLHVLYSNMCYTANPDRWDCVKVLRIGVWDAGRGRERAELILECLNLFSKRLNVF